MNCDIAHLEQKVRIARAENGPILLGRYVTCDGFDWDREVAVCTHFHSDHYGDFHKWLHYCQAILCSPETKELLIALEQDEGLRLRGYFKGLTCGMPYLHRGEHITLYPTKHMLGSVQVLVEDEEGTRIVYTGDFDYPNTKPVKADILVVDATYGKPDLPVFEKNQVVEMLVSLVAKEIKHRPVCIIAHRGKMQEVMQILSGAGFNIPFFCPLKEAPISVVYQNFGARLGNLQAMQSSAMQQIIKERQPHIIFHLWSHDIRESLAEGVQYTKILVSRFHALEPLGQLGYNYYQIAISAHSSFDGIIEYVRESDPKLVITDGSRAEYYAMLLATEIENRLGIKAKAMP